jgi:Alcohol dehydrogenase GroES-like domain/SnoaL-like domain
MPNAAVLTTYGPPEVLEWKPVPMPEPSEGQIRIKVCVSGVSPTDLKIRRGDLKAVFPVPEPAVLGFETAGVVDAIGSEVSGVAVGDEVAALIIIDAGPRPNPEADPRVEIHGREAFISAMSASLEGVHTAHNMFMPEITIDDDTHAHATWGLHDYVKTPFVNFNGYGHIRHEYIKVDGEWKISQGRTTRMIIDEEWLTGEERAPVHNSAGHGRGDATGSRPLACANPIQLPEGEE